MSEDHLGRYPYGIHRSQGMMPVTLAVTLLVPGEKSIKDAVESVFKLGAVPSIGAAEWGDVYPITDVSEVLP